LTSIQTPAGLLEVMRKLRSEVLSNADEIFGAWQPAITRPGFAESAHNLARYLALRRHELPSLQLALMRWGLSSLGRCESHVQATLDAVIATLGAMCGHDPTTLPPYPDDEAVFNGTQVIAREAESLFGGVKALRRTRILVTLPTEASEDLPWMQALVHAGVDCVRINCAHDTSEVWSGMLRTLRVAERELGSREPIHVLMDLGGPKVRTVRPKKHDKDVYQAGDKLLLTAASNLEHASRHHHGKHNGRLPVVGCTLPQALDRLSAGERVFIDDGLIGARTLERVADGVVIQITHAPSQGHKIRSDKGLNFPDTDFEVASLTEKDRSDLTFVVQHADMVGYSFVQTEADIAALLEEISERVPGFRCSRCTPWSGAACRFRWGCSRCGARPHRASAKHSRSLGRYPRCSAGRSRTRRRSLRSWRRPGQVRRRRHRRRRIPRHRGHRTGRRCRPGCCRKGDRRSRSWLCRSAGSRRCRCSGRGLCRSPAHNRI
jgi:pyruvate kinase